MPFDETDLDNLLEAFGARTVTVKLSGAAVKTFQGVYREGGEFVSPHNAEMVVVKPYLLCKQSDLVGVDRSHTLDHEVKGEFRIYGDFLPQRSGLSRVGLTK